LKLHIVADEVQKIVGFTLKPGNLHDYLREGIVGRVPRHCHRGQGMLL
jgi:hypothetical protein